MELWFLQCTLINFATRQSSKNFCMRRIKFTSKPPEYNNFAIINPLTSLTGQEASVRFDGQIGHIFNRSSLAPGPTRIFSKSEGQCVTRVPFRANVLVSLLDWPIRMTSVASDGGHHTTLARNNWCHEHHACDDVKVQCINSCTKDVHWVQYLN